MSAVMLSVLSGCDSRPVYPLHVEGSALLSSKGDTVVLRGISYGWHNLGPHLYNSSSVKNILKTSGSNLLRFSMGVDDLTGPDGNVAEGYLSNPSLGWKCITECTDAAIREGAYVIIDWHSHEIHRKEAIAFFDAVSRLYSGVPNVIYEIFNEPVNDSWHDVKAYSEAVIDAIRANAPEAVILVGTPHWDQDIDLAVADPIKNRTNIMYTVHFYAGTHGQELIAKADKALEKKVPVFISECGAMESTGRGDFAWESWEQWLSWADKHSISMALWSFSDMEETCSMLLPSAKERGGWGDGEFSEWGIYSRSFVGDYAKKMPIARPTKEELKQMAAEKEAEPESDDKSSK